MVNRAGTAASPAAPGDRAGVDDRYVIPIHAVHHIVAVGQRRHAVEADLIVGDAAHQAVGSGYWPVQPAVPLHKVAAPTLAAVSLFQSRLVTTYLPLVSSVTPP